MRRSGFEFGSHTLTHPELTSLNMASQWREISGSKEELEKALDAPCEFFCFPYGRYDSEALCLVRASGYLGACTNIPGVNQKVNPYLLRRTEISGFDTLEEFIKKMAGAYDLMHQTLHWVRGRP